jgi:hypothetical protein
VIDIGGNVVSEDSLTTAQDPLASLPSFLRKKTVTADLTELPE